jgi:hypothetical protein
MEADLRPSLPAQGEEAEILLCTERKLSGIVGPNASTIFLELGEITTKAGTVGSPCGIIIQQKEDLFRMDKPRGVVTQQEEDIIGVDEPSRCSIELVRES